MIIRNGTVVTPAGLKKADLYLELGRIRSIRKALRIQGEETIDASGAFILPGMVDAHVHLRDFREVYKEDYLSGTSAALAGGVTSVIDMPNNSLPTISMEALEAKKAVAARKALCNYGFHFGATAENFDEARGAAGDPSVASLKIYMGSSTGSLLLDDFGAFYRHLANFRKIITLHAEDEHAMRHFASLFAPSSARVHGKVRNESVAEIAVTRALSVAERTGAKLHFCHVSTGKEVALITAAKRALRPLSCEVTPHHLFLDDSLAGKLGNFAKVNPPLRTKVQVKELWSALARNEIDLIASDHAPHPKEEKQKPYAEAPSGVPELDTSLLLFLDAVSRKKMALPQLVNLFSSSPARRFGLRSKGSIAVGKDADLVIVSLKDSTKIRNENLFTKCKWSPYDGWKLRGKVRATVLGGKLAFDGESILARIGDAEELRFRQ